MEWRSTRAGGGWSPQMLPLCLRSGTGSHQRGHMHEGQRLSKDLVLGGPCCLLAWGHCALCGCCGWRGDACKGPEAVGVHRWDEGQ